MGGKTFFLIAFICIISAFAALLHAQVAPAQPGEIAGIVTDEQGKPIEGALVDVWTWYRGNETKTDKDGRFRLKKLAKNGQVELRITKDGFCPWYAAQQDTGVDLNVALNDHTYFEGVVRSPDGQPVPNALIRADNGPQKGPDVEITNLWTETRSDSAGHYRLYVTPAKYDIQVRVPKVGVYRTSERATINASETQTLDIPLEKGITFVAKLLDSETSAPVPGVKISHWEHPGIEGTSDADGVITIDGMVPGKFEFDFKAAGFAQWWSGDATEGHQRTRNPNLEGNWDGLEFEIKPDMRPVGITMERAVTITGKVVDPDGKPVEGATVAPAHTGTGNSITGDTRFSVSTKPDGTYTMPLPASGDVEYNLIAHDGKYGKWRTWANGVGEPVKTKPGEKVESVTLTLTRGASVKGRVINTAGDPVAGKTVRAVTNDGRDNRYYVPETRTDKDGNYELKFIRPGSILVQVEPYWLDPNQAPEKTSETLQVDAGESKDGIVLTFTPHARGR